MTGERERGNQGDRNGAVSMGCAQALAKLEECTRIKEIIESVGKSAFNPMDLLHHR